jgi:hypothetical protein
MESKHSKSASATTNSSDNAKDKMATYQIEATIEKFSQDGIELKGAGKYLFEKSSEKKKSEDKEYCNIFELKPDKKPSEKQDEESSIELKSVKDDEESSIELKSVKYNEPIYFDDAIFKDLLIQAFIEKKKLKFDLLEEDKGGNKEYTITAVSHAST